jgi:hypothetical protein
MIRCLKVALLILFLLVGCNVAAKNQDDSKPVKIRKLVRGKDGIYRVPQNSESDARKAAEAARESALQAKKEFESRQKDDKVEKFKFNFNYISLYYFTFLMGLMVYIFIKDKKNERNSL